MYRNNSARLSGGYRATSPQRDVVDEQPLSPTRRRSPLLPSVVPLAVSQQPLSPTRRRSPLLSNGSYASTNDQVIDEEAYESPIPSVKRSSKSTSTEVFTPQANGDSRIVTIRRTSSPPPVRRTSTNGMASTQRSYSPQRSRRSTELSVLPSVKQRVSRVASRVSNRMASQHSPNKSVTVSFEMSASDPNYQAIVELLRQCTTEDKCKMIKDHLAVGYDTEHTLDEAAAGLRNLSIFSLLARRTGLNDVLSQEKLTVFAPDNSAFQQLASTLGPARTDEQVASTLLSKLGTENVRNTLLDHVVPDIWNADYLSKISNVDLITTSNQPLSIMPDNMGLSVAVGDKSAEVVEADIPASNGVIHIINSII